MANTKISELTELLVASASDVVPIVDTLNDQTKKITVTNLVAVADGSVTTAKLADGAVTTVKVADTAVSTAKIADDAVTTAKVADSAVTTAKVADDAVTADKLANTSVTAGSYTLSSITVDAQGRLTAASSGTAADTDKIVEGNTEAEVVDTGSDGHFKVTTEGTERVRVGPAGQIGIAGANYGTSGQVLTSGGASGAISWAAVSTPDISGKADIASPTFTGTPAAPTASSGTNTTQIATTAFVNTEIAADIAGKANIASPTFTGTPAAPTASSGTNTTQLATTAFVTTAVAAGGGLPDLSQADVNIHGLTVGQGSGNVSTNTTVGFEALNSNSSGNKNTAIGYEALYSSTSSNNDALGYQAQKYNTGSQCVGIGYQAMGGQGSARDFYQCVGVGYRALSNNTASSNTAVGYNAGNLNTSGTVTAFGRSAGNSNTTGNITAIGDEALKNNTTGLYNTAVGRGTLDANTTGYYHTACGKDALGSNTTGIENTAFGYLSLSACTTGDYNIGVGKQAGNNITTGQRNIVIGYEATASSATVNNEITLGNSQISALRCQVTTITGLSDGRDKTDVEPLAQGLDLIDLLKPVKFKWETRDGNIKDGTYEAGFIAQDLQSAQSEVNADYLGLVYDENPDRLEASYGKLVPVLVNAVQELTSMVKVLQAEIKTLKS